MLDKQKLESTAKRLEEMSEFSLNLDDCRNYLHCLIILDLSESSNRDSSIKNRLVNESAHFKNPNDLESSSLKAFSFGDSKRKLPGPKHSGVMMPK